MQPFHVGRDRLLAQVGSREALEIESLDQAKMRVNGKGAEELDIARRRIDGLAGQHTRISRSQTFGQVVIAADVPVLRFVEL